MKNVLFSTTRQWNPGDEFILFGIMNVLRSVIGDFNPVIYNRNPETRQSFQYLSPFRRLDFIHYSFRLHELVEAFLRLNFMDNSFKDTTPLEAFDLVVFAGSPEFASRRLKPLYRKLERCSRPTVYLGVGQGPLRGNIEFPKPFDRVLRKTKLLAVRDRRSAEVLKDYGAVYLPCPSILASPREKHIEDMNRLGLVFSTHKTVDNQRIRPEASRYLVELYGRLLETHNGTIICHYIDELPEAVRLFPGAEVLYSYDAKDYFEIYEQFDLVVASRVHGIGVAASLGIPGVHISHDWRAGTTEGFLAEHIAYTDTLENAVGKVADFASTAPKASRALIAHKQAVHQEYSGRLAEALGCRDNVSPRRGPHS